MDTTHFVYIVECTDGSLYTGITKDIANRLQQHNGEKSGGAKYTKTRRPVALKFVEEHHCFTSAAQREVEIKRFPRPKKLKLLGC